MQLTHETLILFAAKHYDLAPSSNTSEFMKDLDIPILLKKLFGRYVSSGELRERLILNHMITFFNVFDPDAANKILFFRIEEKYYSILKSFLVFLNRCPNQLEGVDIDSIPLDFKTLEKLRKI